MKKQVEIIIVLSILFSSFVIGCQTKILFSTVQATYVEGQIDQNTLWTLADSPFLLSNDLTVNQNVTLTIEPGVEVRFGGPFSLTINGMLNATGTSDKMIRFTTNDPAHNVTWQNMTVAGGQWALLVNCIVEYGVNGVIVENGVLTVQNSTVTSNRETGIKVDDGTAVLENNVIMNNMNGIEVVGGTQVTLTNNLVKSNNDGIVLDGNLTNTDIENNQVWYNQESGVVLNSTTYGTITIRGNDVSSNGNGFLVSTDTSPLITRNYISNNEVGILYQTGINHQAHFNDIYDNTVGVDISDETVEPATANVTYNYWGDSSGPFHGSANLNGKGNPVGGDGATVDFIFFLTFPIDYNNAQPTAVLWADRTLTTVDQNITFVGADSYDDGVVEQFYYEFGDGNTSGWTTLSVFTHAYAATGMYTASLKVADDFGVISNVATMIVDVQNLPTLQTHVALSSYIVPYMGQTSVDVYVSDGVNGVENAQVTLLSVTGGNFSMQTTATDSNGYLSAMFTAPNITELANIRIIATVRMNGYADSSDFTYLIVLPPLSVQISTEPSTIKSEDTANVKISVLGSYQQPVQNASITITCDAGNLSASNALTGFTGETTLTYTAPRTLVDTTVTIGVTASKAGYADGTYQRIINVYAKVLNVELAAQSDSIASSGQSTIVATVTSDGAPIADVLVSMSSDVGEFSTTSGMTDSNGTCTLTYSAPKTTIQIPANLTATATKTGYADGSSQTSLVITPETAAEGGGIPWLIILLLLIPAVIAVVVVILVKKKIIVISQEEET